MALKAGRICGNPLQGLCNRVCIQVDRIFDGCRLELSDVILSLPLESSLFGYNFISASFAGDSELTNLVIIDAGDGRARIEADVVSEVTISYSDQSGNTYTTTAPYVLHRSVVLRVPTNILTPYRVTAYTYLSGLIGSFTEDGRVRIEACVVQIIKIVARVDLLIPVYENCSYPICNEVEGICQATLNRDLFPPL